MRKSYNKAENETILQEYFSPSIIITDKRIRREHSLSKDFLFYPGTEPEYVTLTDVE